MNNKMTFEEYRSQDVIETGDGEFFGALEEMFATKNKEGREASKEEIQEIIDSTLEGIV